MSLIGKQSFQEIKGLYDRFKFYITVFSENTNLPNVQ